MLRGRQRLSLTRLRLTGPANSRRRKSPVCGPCDDLWLRNGFRIFGIRSNRDVVAL
jgi:hypothetical protein